jgi:cobalt-zinc-cadmium efflux system membrane fusion protein
MTTRRSLLFLPMLLCLCAGCSSGPAGENNSASVPPAKKDLLTLSESQQQEGGISAQAVRLTSEPRTLHVTGKIALADDRTARLGVRTIGLVMEVYAQLGDYVKKGQVLARFHADEVRDTRAMYRTAVAQLHTAQSGAALAQKNYERAQTLLDLKAASQQQVETARQEVAAAQTTVQSAQIEVDRTIDVLEDDLKVPAEPKPGVELADQVPIISPIDGFVIEKNITPGRTVELNSDTFVIGDLSEVWMLASVRPEELANLRVGQVASVTVSGMPGQTYPGKIANLGQEADPATRLVQIRIVLANPKNRLRPEMLADAAIQIPSQQQALLVPSDALQQIDGQDVVFVKSASDRFVVRPVHTGDTWNGQTTILEGLHSGEQVVVRGSFVLKSQLLKSTMESD